MVDRNHVGVGVDVLVKCLGVAVVRTEPQSGVVKTNTGYAGKIHADIISVPRVSCPELIQHGWAESMDVTELEIGCC